MKLDEIREVITTGVFNLKKLSREIGISYNKLRYVLYGENPPYRNVEKISDFLEKKLDNKFESERNISEKGGSE